MWVSLPAFLPPSVILSQTYVVCAERLRSLHSFHNYLVSIPRDLYVIFLSNERGNRFTIPKRASVRIFTHNNVLGGEGWSHCSVDPHLRTCPECNRHVFSGVFPLLTPPLPLEPRGRAANQGEWHGAAQGCSGRSRPACVPRTLSPCLPHSGFSARSFLGSSKPFQMNNVVFLGRPIKNLTK